MLLSKETASASERIARNRIPTLLAHHFHLQCESIPSVQDKSHDHDTTFSVVSKQPFIIYWRDHVNRIADNDTELPLISLSFRSVRFSTSIFSASASNGRTILHNELSNLLKDYFFRTLLKIIVGSINGMTFTRIIFVTY